MTSSDNAEERFQGMDDGNIEACEGVTETRKQFVGVSKLKNGWQARVWHPVLKFDIYLGTYKTPEEAAVAVNKKKAEFKEMFEGGNSVGMIESIGDEYVGKKLPSGVCRRGRRTWSARIWHPELRYSVSLGSYSSPEEAEFVIEKMRVEFRKMYGGTKRVESTCDDVLEGTECESLRPSFDCVGECSVAVEVPNGVRKCESGKWIAGIRDVESRGKIWLGTFDTVEEALRAYNKKRIALAAKRRRGEFVMSECRDKFSRHSEGVGAVEEAESDGRYGCINSVSGTENLSSGAVNDKSNCGVAFDVPDNLQSGFVDYYLTSVRDLSDCRGVDAINISQDSQERIQCASNFDEAMSLGFINEYGQLLGDYSMLDEKMGFNLPDEDVAFPRSPL